MKQHKERDGAMALIQVGTVAIRSPSGDFLPAVPILKEIPDNDRTEVITEQELERLFVDRMKQYVAAKQKERKSK